MFQSDSGGTACVRPLRHSSVAPGMQKAKAPTKGLSELNSMAFGFAVYASQCGLPLHHARLASSCWSGSTARDFHPQGSYERFQSCNLHLIPLSQALLGAIDATDASFNLCKLRAVGRPLSLDALCRPRPTPNSTTRRWGLTAVSRTVVY